MSDKPFVDYTLDMHTRVRCFDEDVAHDKLVWHRDGEYREIQVVSGDRWQLQIDNELPQTLEIGQSYRIPKEVYHRLIRGLGNLVVIIDEQDPRKAWYDAR